MRVCGGERSEGKRRGSTTTDAYLNVCSCEPSSPATLRSWRTEWKSMGVDRVDRPSYAGNPDPREPAEAVTASKASVVSRIVGGGVVLGSCADAISHSRYLFS